MRAFVIDVERISGQTGSSLEVDLSWTSESLDLGSPEIELIGDIRFKGSVSNVGNAYSVSGKLRADGKLVCDRCLETFEKKFDMPLLRVFSEDGFGSEGFDQDDVEKMTGDEIDLAPHIREELLLSIPIKVLCKDDCKGICPQCGKDMNKGECICLRAE